MKSIEFKRVCLVFAIFFVASCDRSVDYKSMDKLFTDALEEKLDSGEELSDSDIRQNISRRGSSGDTLLTIAIERGSADLVSRILRFAGRELLQEDSNGDHPLILTVRQGSIDILKELIAAFSKLSIKFSEDIKGKLVDEITKLEEINLVAYKEIREAVKEVGVDSVEIVKIRKIVEDIRRRAEEKNKNITILAMEELKDKDEDDRLDILKFLIAGLSGEEINRTDDGISALNYALENNKLEVVEMLLSNREIEVSIEEEDISSLRRREDVKLLIELLRLSNISIDCSGYPALIKTVETAGETMVIRPLAQSGCDKTLRSLIKCNENTRRVFDEVLLRVVGGYENELASFLIEVGADKNIVNEDGLTLSMVASCHNEVVLKMLLEKGANIEATDSEERRLLTYVVVNDQEDILELLFKMKVKLNAVDKRGYTALMMAAESGKRRMVELLIDRGADTTIKTESGSTVLRCATNIKDSEEDEEEKMIEVIKVLFDRRSNMDRKDLWHTLVMTVNEGRTKLLDMMFNHENGDAIDDDMRLSLMLVASSRSDSQIDILSANSGEVIENLRRVVEYLSERCSMTISELFTDIDVWEREGRIVLKGAVREGDVDVVKILIKSLRINASEGQKLFSHVSNNGKEMIELLLGVGARVSADEDDNTVLMRAVESRNVGVVEALLGIQEKIEDRKKSAQLALMRAAKSGQVGVVNALLAKGADINATDSERNTALMIASDSGHVEVVNALIGFGAKLEECDELGFTALMLAVHKGRVDVVGTLLDHGVEVDAEDNKGWTSLILAAEAGNIEIVEMLIGRGADIDHEQEDGADASYVTSNQAIIDLLKEEKERR